MKLSPRSAHAGPAHSEGGNRKSKVLNCASLAAGVALALGAWIAPLTAEAQTTVAGVTSGALSVDETGSASYTIPIAVPPGIAGMQPSVALVYQSHGGNGTAGVGWGLSAASSIHRCSQTLAQDGAIHGVDFSADDRFCLDGQRLVAISGTYGADGSEYRTEVDSFARIISHGSAGSGPLYFTVETKSGRTMEFGNTTDSRLAVPGANEIRLWSLNRIEDTSGNAMTYHYEEDTGDSSYRLDHIEYTSNAGQAVTPQSEVRFVYEARTDTRSGYLAGAELAMTKRLAAVETWSDTGSGIALVKSYGLAYETSPATNRSRLTAVTECDAGNNCLQPVDLGWQGQIPAYTKSDVSTSWGMTLGVWDGQKRKAHIFDYNGDGFSDILLQGKSSSHGTQLLTGSSTGFVKEVITSSWGMTAAVWAADQRNLFILDYNGDGFSDILLQGKSSTQGSRLLTSTGTGFTVENVNSSWGMTTAVWAADQRNLFVLDYNGDGLSDILLQGLLNTQGSRLLTSTGTGFAVENVNAAWGMSTTTWAANQRKLHILDHNGDGLSDILLQGTSDTQGSRLLTSKGDGFNTVENVNTAWGMNLDHWAANQRHLHVLDHNGDGLHDLLFQGTAANEGSYLLVSNGNGFTTVENISNAWGVIPDNWAGDQRNLFILDHDADGLSDILLQGRSPTNSTFLLTHDGPAPDLLTSVTDSLGRVSVIDYAPLTDGTVYTKDSDAVFPVVDIQAPLYVVKSVSSDDGLGGQKETTYSYAGAKVHLQGRGFRGFRQMTASDQQTGIVTTTDYSQVFPTTAQVLSSVKTLADGTTVKTIANTWDALSLNGGATLWPYVASSTSEDYEPNDGPGNSPIVSRTATAVFDGYGNPTSLTTATSGGGESFTETTVNTYDNLTTPWLLGLLRRSEVTRSRPGGQ